MAFDIRFCSSSSTDAGAFRLLELPKELCSLIESGADSGLRFTIKGQPNEDAVLCTSDKTYALRSVTLSNTVLVVTPENASNDLIIRDQVNEILELVPSVPKLHKLSRLLSDVQYDESQDSEIFNSTDKASQGRFSYEDARSQIQASDAELEHALKALHVLVVDGQLRPISPSYLATILELLLNYLVSLSLPLDAAPVEELVSTLADEHEISRMVSTQVMSWFGATKEENWSVDINSVLKEIGIGLLKNHRDDPIPKDEFIQTWKSVVGDTFESHVSLTLLLGNFILSPHSDLTYFPASSLPVDPAARFADIFLTRPRWNAEDIDPFLTDIAVNSKERDKLLLKYARANTDADGVWYTARTKYH